MTRTQKRNQFKQQLLKVKAINLQEWLDEASQISPEFSNALEGFYCGREGKIHEELCDGIYITMGWHTYSTPKVEYCYIS